MPRFNIDASVKALKQTKLMMKERISPDDTDHIIQYNGMDTQIEFARWFLGLINDLKDGDNITEPLQHVGMMFGAMTSSVLRFVPPSERNTAVQAIIGEMVHRIEGNAGSIDSMKDTDTGVVAGTQLVREKD